MNVGEMIDVVVTIGLGPGAAQLIQRAGAEGAESEEAARLQHAPHLGERDGERLAPLQHQIAVDQIDAAVLQRKARRVAAHPIEAPPWPLVPARLA
jgi:hypothetical protein